MEPKYKKYDDNAFQRDLESLQNPYDDVDVKKIIRSALRVEDETRQLKKKHGLKVDSQILYQPPPKENKDQK